MAKRRSARQPAALAVLFFTLAAGTALANSTVHVTRHWHLHQPLYWPEWNTLDGQVNRVQTAWDSIQIKAAGGNMYPGSGVVHPQNVLVEGDPGEEGVVFSPDDRVNAYQHGPKDSLSKITDMPNAGYSMSFSGALQENVGSLGRRDVYRYKPDWNSHNTTARSWMTAGGNTRLDLVNFTYHHAMGPLIPKSVLRKEIQIFKEIWWKTWGGNPDKSDQSKGFWPAEASFSRHMIDVLVDEGIEWSIVANHHLSRTCQNYHEVAGVGTDTTKMDPPNRADILGPYVPPGQYWSGGQHGRGAVQAAPFAYQAHKVKYVNPETGAEKVITVVPMADIISFGIGAAAIGTEQIDSFISPYSTDANRPTIVLMSTDGENAWGGGNTSWQQATPDLLHASSAKGYDVTTIQQFLDDHPVPDSAVVHIEDGSWFNADNDWGSPMFLNWLNPPLNMAGGGVQNDPFTRFDFETPGWHVDFRNWAVLMAGANYVETAEQIYKDNNGPDSVQAWRIQEPYQLDGTYNNPNVAELGWHIYLAGFDSGFMYFGVWTDDEVKHTLAVNRTIETVGGYVMDNIAQDTTPPSVFKPQRYPWNPGGKGYGHNTDYKPVGFNGVDVFSSDFYIWTHVHDVSGVSRVTLKVREDADGVNTMANNQNETYAGGNDVGAWKSLSMQERTLPTHDPSNNSQIDFFMTPTEMAKYYFVKVNGYRGKLLDYYVEAVDSRGNIHKSDIQHVYVEDDGTPGYNSSSTTFSSDPRDCAPLVVTFDSTHGDLEGVSPVYQQISFDDGASWARTEMTSAGSNVWIISNTVPDNAPSAIVWYENHDGSVTDSHGGGNWQAVIRDCDAPVGPGAAAFENASACAPVTVKYFPNTGELESAAQIYAHIGFDGWEETRGGQAMTRVSNNLWQITFVPTNNATMLDVVFHDGDGTWDNNSGSDWHFGLNECTGNPGVSGFVITNPAGDIAVGNGVTVHDLNGVADGVSGQLTWTNDLTGGSGTHPVSSPFAITGIPLGVGANTITVRGTNTVLENAVIASDTSSGYTQESWTNGANGGEGFGSWTMNGVDGSSGWFVNENGFGLWSHETNHVSEAIRPFVSGLAAGETFTARLKNGWIWENFANPAAAGSVGLELRDGSGTTQWYMSFTGGGSTYQSTDGDTGLGWTDAGVDIAFTLDTADDYTVVLTPVGGTPAQFSGTIPGAVAQVRVWSDGNGTADGQNSNRDLYFDDLSISAAGVTVYTSNDTVVITRSGPGGDTNGDGIPDAWYQAHGVDHATPGRAAMMTPGGQATYWEEYVYDTNPTNPASYHMNKVMVMNESGSINIRVEAPTSPDRVYDIFWATNLFGSSWTAAGLDVPGNLDGSAVTLTIPDPAAVRYYRTGPKLPAP